eukprot:156724_1
MSSSSDEQSDWDTDKFNEKVKNFKHKSKRHRGRKRKHNHHQNRQRKRQKVEPNVIVRSGATYQYIAVASGGNFIQHQTVQPHPPPPPPPPNQITHLQPPTTKSVSLPAPSDRVQGQCMKCFETMMIDHPNGSPRKQVIKSHLTHHVNDQEIVFPLYMNSRRIGEFTFSGVARVPCVFDYGWQGFLLYFQRKGTPPPLGRITHSTSPQPPTHSNKSTNNYRALSH